MSVLTYMNGAHAPPLIELERTENTAVPVRFATA